MDKPLHLPVMARETLEYLNPRAGESYLDITAGYGGHAEMILEHTRAPQNAVLIDRDQDAVRYLRQKFDDQVEIIHQDFLIASRQQMDNGRQFDMILADLGVSSPHLEMANRGFSIKTDGPLDMRMDQQQAVSAYQIVNEATESELRQLLKEYGEEPKAAQIARRIVDHRPVTSTGQLAAIAAKAWRGRSKVHPATRTFQAIRIAVNDELNQLEQSLPVWAELLAPGGRLAVISFHSLEDRIVKRFFAEQAHAGYEAEMTILTKKAVRPSQNEIVSNPRARSAKLRASIKNKNNRKDKRT